ncbi:MAG: hypothetical protein HUJ61_02200, partial [Bacilli bacterium]|nr:hypothetical protein [Bacilli bacterium]
MAKEKKAPKAEGKNPKKKKIGKWIGLGVTILLVGTYGGLTAGNYIEKANLIKYAKSFDEVDYEGNQLVPAKDRDGN